jgi:xylan 1,4-beta-xylosidase
VNLQVQLQPSTAPLRKPWKNAIAVGRAYELLREDALEHLRFVQRSIGYRYCRFHGLFHDEMAVVDRREDGALAFRWHQIDKVYDALLKMDLRPFVELNPMPSALASGQQTIFDWRMNVTPPRDYREWEQLVEAFTRHCVDRYGIDEVRQWYFEVWNEPNLEGFWSGTKEEYWQLYAAAAHAVKRVSQDLKIGGPASSKASWIGDIIAHCTANGLPLDFVSTHLYPQDEYVTYPDRKGSPHEPGEFFSDTVRSVQVQVAKSSRPDLEIHWTEWNSLSTASTSAVTWTKNTWVDSINGAALICKTCVTLDDACNTLCWWVASDVFEESGMPQSEFSSTYGLVTINGLPKATFNAFEFLNRLGNVRCETVSDEALPHGCGWCATRSGDTLQVLLWHQVLPEVGKQKEWQCRLALPIAVADNYFVIQSRIGVDGGSAWESWVELGQPQDLSTEEMRFLRSRAQPDCQLFAFPSAKDSILMSLAIQPAEVYLLELRRQGPTALPKTGLRAQLAQWEQQMSDASKA